MMECEERWKEQGLGKDLASTYVLHPLETKVVLNFRGDEIEKDTVGCIVKGRNKNYKLKF